MVPEWNVIHIRNDVIGNVLQAINEYVTYLPNDFGVTKNVDPDKNETNILGGVEGVEVGVEVGLEVGVGLLVVFTTCKYHPII